MDFQAVREQMAAFLRPGGGRGMRLPEGGGGNGAGRWPLCPCGPARAGRAAFGITWGRYDESTGQWQELYGRRVTLTFGLDLYGESAGELQTAYDRMAEAFQWEGPAGLALRELSCGETEFDRAAGLYRRAVTAVCQGYLYAVADEGGTFLDFVVRGEGHL
ncbi:MAG: hypothetical protein ACLUES_03275 [Flavonifractor plautii]